MKIFIFRETELKDITPTINAGIGATESSVISLACELAKNGHTVKVCCPCRPGYYDSVEYISFKSYGITRIQVAVFEPDILIVAGNPKIFTDGPIQVNKVFFWHQNHPEELIRFPMREILKLPNMTYIFPSPESADYGKKFYNSENIAGIYNGIRKQFFEIPFVEKKNEIVYVGSLTRAKGVLELLKIVKSIPWPIKICGSFDMYGFIDEAYKQACEPFLETVEMLGALPPYKLAEAVSQACLCIVNPLIGNKETCCVSALESMAVGTCVVSGGHSLIDPIVNRGGVVCLGDLSTVINNLIKTPDIIEQLANQGKRWAGDLMWKNIVKEWENQLF